MNKIFHLRLILCFKMDSVYIYVKSVKYWINFQKGCKSNIVFGLRIIMYFGALITNMIVKIGANLIFLVKSSKNHKNHGFFGLSQLLCKIKKNL